MAEPEPYCALLKAWAGLVNKKNVLAHTHPQPVAQDFQMLPTESTSQNATWLQRGWNYEVSWQLLLQKPSPGSTCQPHIMVSMKAAIHNLPCPEGAANLNHNTSVTEGCVKLCVCQHLLGCECVLRSWPANVFPLAHYNCRCQIQC